MIILQYLRNFTFEMYDQHDHKSQPLRPPPTQINSLHSTLLFLFNMFSIASVRALLGRHGRSLRRLGISLDPIPNGLIGEISAGCPNLRTFSLHCETISLVDINSIQVVLFIMTPF